MAAQFSEVFSRPIDFQTTPGSPGQNEREAQLLAVLQDLLSRAEAMDAFQRPDVTDENFPDYKTAAYFVTVSRQKARGLLQEARQIR